MPTPSVVVIGFLDAVGRVEFRPETYLHSTFVDFGASGGVCMQSVVREFAGKGRCRVLREESYSYASSVTVGFDNDKSLYTFHLIMESPNPDAESIWKIAVIRPDNGDSDAG